MAPHSSTLAWKISWAVVHGVAKSQTRLSDFTFIFHFHALEKEMAPVFLLGESQGRGSPVGCHWPVDCTAAWVFLAPASQIRQQPLCCRHPDTI